MKSADDSYKVTNWTRCWSLSAIVCYTSNSCPVSGQIFQISYRHCLQEITTDPQFSLWMLPCACVNGACPRTVFNRRKKQNEQLQAIIHYPAALQTSYRCQKSHWDEYGWKQPADKAMSDRARPRFRKERNMTGTTRGLWLLISLKSLGCRQKNDEFPISQVPSWCRRFCLYLLPHINYSNWGWQREGWAYIIQGPPPV